jgi:DNA primase
MQNLLLNTTNPQHLTLQYEQILFSVLGGIRLNNLDSMRATVRIEFMKCQPIRHNLDLYNDSQLEKLVRKCAERFEIGTVYIGKAIGELINQLENYRMEELKKLSITQQLKKYISEEEKQAARENLGKENLMQQTMDDLQSTGIQGEQANSMILKMAMGSRKLPDPISVVCLAKSGTGKSYLMERVALCIPEEDIREQTQFTGASFYHFKIDEIKGKVFLIEDLQGAKEAMFPIAELQTKKRISKTMTVKGENGKMHTVTLIVEGPVSVISCGTQEKLIEDNANRVLIIYLDSSSEQDERIMHYQKQVRAGLIDRYKEKNVQKKLQNMQRVLEPIRVINPYAPLINLPKEIFKPRRTLPILLSFIEAITFYCQYLREQKCDEPTGEIYIETHPDDIEWAFKLLKDVLFRKSDELSGAVREFYEWLKNWNRQNKKKEFYANDIRKENKMKPRTLNRYLQELTEYGMLEIAGGNKHRSGYAYKIIGGKDFENLQISIEAQIKQVMENVWKAYHGRDNKAAKNKRK